MLKQIVRNFALFGTVIALFTNIFIFTYPSIHPSRCSWNCSKEQSLDQTFYENSTMLEKVIFYSKRYATDVKTQLTDPSLTTANKDNDIHMLAFGDPQIRGVWKSTPYQTRLDIFGNDYFLGHIYTTMMKRLKPTHVAVMGDLFSSQWILDSEFYNRTKRYMGRLFQRNLTKLEEIRKENHDEDGLYKIDWHKWADEFSVLKNADAFEFGFSDVHSWDPENEDFLFVNLTGNHDVGYSGDATYQHMARFNQIFGKDNYWIEYDSDTDKAWRIVVLNDLLLEGPALQPEFLEYTWRFLERLSERNFTGSTVLLTHIPFYKKEGLCVDGPQFRYYPPDHEREPYKRNLLRSQNHISEEVSNIVLNMIFNNNKPGVILTGHDHEGCETIYNRFDDTNKWEATHIPLQEADHHILEITVRSMMGEFFGNTGLLTGHFDETANHWEWSYTLCPFTLQHAWWSAKVSILITILAWSLFLVL